MRTLLTLTIMFLSVLLLSLSASATIYFEAPCDNTINYGGTEGAGGTFSLSGGVCTLLEIDSGSASGYYFNVSGVPASGIVYMDVKNWRVDDAVTSAWISARNVTLVDVLIFQNQFGGFLNDEASGFVKQGGYVEVTEVTTMVESPTEYRNMTLALNYDNGTFAIFVNETIQIGSWELFEEADGGPILGVDFLTNSYGTGSMTWEGMCFRDDATAFGCPVATGPVLNITIFAPDQNKHYNSDLVAVFNTSGVDNGTCNLIVNSFVMDAVSDINSSASNYSLTWSPVSEGNNSWFIDCFDTSSSVTATPDSVTVVVGTQHGNASNLTSQDGSFLHIEEVSGAPGIDLHMNWTAQLDLPEQGNFYLNYEGNHLITIQGWNATSWEGAGNFTDQGGLFWENFSAISPQDRFVVDGQVSVRLYHPQNGNPNDDLFIDYAELLFTDSATSTQSVIMYYLVDLTDGTIDNVAPVQDENISTSSYGLDIRFNDTYISQTETNLSCGYVEIFYNKTTQLAETFNVSNTTSFAGIESTCLGQFRIADEHTDELIGLYSVLPGIDRLLFDTDKGAALTMKSVDAVSASSSKLKDRHTVSYVYSDLKDIRSYTLTSQWSILYNELRSEYPSFVLVDPDNFGGHWADYNNPNLKSWVVKRINDHEYDIVITFDKAVDHVTFSSVGGLNVFEKNVTFNVDTVNPRVWSGPRINVSTTILTTHDYEFNTTDASVSTGYFYTNETGSWVVEETFSTINGTQKDLSHTYTRGGLIKWGYCALDTFGNRGCDDNFTLFLNVSIPDITLNSPEPNLSTRFHSIELIATVTQSVPMPDTIIFYTDESGSWQEVNRTTWVSGVPMSYRHAFSDHGIFSWYVTANDTIGSIATSENRSINISEASFRGVFPVGSCPDDSVQEVGIFGLMFIILITFYIVSKIYIRLPIIDIGLGVGMIFFSFPLYACMTMMGGAALLVGIGMIVSGILD